MNKSLKTGIAFLFIMDKMVPRLNSILQIMASKNTILDKTVYKFLFLNYTRYDA